jgi:thioredoxin reductase
MFFGAAIAWRLAFMPAADAQILDAAIIGGGPAGLSAALILGRCRRRVLVIDSGEARNAAATGVHGYLGHDGIGPQALRELGRQEIARYSVDWRSDRVMRAEAAPSLDHFPTCFRLTTAQGETWLARKLLFATGMRDVVPDFPGVAECYGATIHHCPYCDGYEHTNQRLLVYGEPATSAVGLALNLRSWSSDVTVLSHGDVLPYPDQERLAMRGIRVRPERIRQFHHAGRQLTGVELGGYGTLAADALFFNTAQQSQCELPAQLGVTCSDDDDGAPTNRKQRTNVPGVLLAGDADGNVQFAIVAAAEGATAATAIHRELMEEDQGRDDYAERVARSTHPDR